MYQFMLSLSDMYDTQNQVKIQLVSFSEDGVLELPMDFYNQIELTDAAQNMTWQGSFTNITSGISVAFDDMDTTDDVEDVMILITDGFHSWDTENMFEKFDEIKAAGVRIIALGFFGQFAFYSPNLFLMTNEVYHAANYVELLALDSTIFNTICENGTLHTSALSSLPERTSVFEPPVSNSNMALLQAAHDWFDINFSFPAWLPTQWKPTR